MSLDFGARFRPLADRILVEVLEAESKTAGGIIVPDVAKEKTQLARVIAVGPGKADSAGKVTTPRVSVGDKVYVQKYAGADVGDKHMVLREDDILGILNDN